MIDAILMTGIITIWLSFGIGFVAGACYVYAIERTPISESK